MLPASNITDPKTQLFIDQLKKQLGAAAEDVTEGTKLEELENNLRNEGRWLTRILATANQTWAETTSEIWRNSLPSACLKGMPVADASCHLTCR